MAKLDHLKILKTGSAPWNEWRKTHEEIIPDLSFADFSDLNLENVNLSEANLTGADFSRSNLSKGNFEEANFSEVDLRRANLSGANLKNVDLSGAYMWGANFTKASLGGANITYAVVVQARFDGAKLTTADLSGSDFAGASLSSANLDRTVLSQVDFSGADLVGASFRDARMWNTKFTSKSTLNLTATPLSQAQLVECVFFRDEEAKCERKKREKRKSQKAKCVETLHVVVTYDDWTPYDMSMFLMATQLLINRIQYVVTTHEQSEEKIKKYLHGHCYPDNEANYIRIYSLSMNSPLDVVVYYLPGFVASSLCIKLIVSCMKNVIGIVKDAVAVRESYNSGSKLKAEEQKLKAEEQKLKAEECKIKAEQLLPPRNEHNQTICTSEKQMESRNAASNYSMPAKVIPAPLCAVLKSDDCETLDSLASPADWLPNNPVIEENKEEFLRESASDWSKLVQAFLRQGATIHVEVKVVRK